MAAPTDSIDGLRADWREQDRLLLAGIDDLTARTADVLTAPGLSAPNAELARIVEGLLGLIRDQLADDDDEPEASHR